MPRGERTRVKETAVSPLVGVGEGDVGVIGRGLSFARIGDAVPGIAAQGRLEHLEQGIPGCILPLEGDRRDSARVRPRSGPGASGRWGWVPSSRGSCHIALSPLRPYHINLGHRDRMYRNIVWGSTLVELCLLGIP